MRSWVKETIDQLSDYITENGWADPTGVVPSIWCGQPERPLDHADSPDAPRGDGPHTHPAASDSD
jgi:hypothetical protein